MPDYDLTRLGSRAFEQLVVSLGRLELGPALGVLGDGPDGGREATFDGFIRWSATAIDEPSPPPAAPTDSDAWSGYTVIQAKHRLHSASRPRENAVWLQQVIKKEIGHWIAAADKHTRSRLPDYLIFVTNVDLSAVGRTRGIATVESLVTRLISSSEAFDAGLHVGGFRIWHADQVRSMIDPHQDVRYAFDGLLTIGDVIAAIGATRMDPTSSVSLGIALREDLVEGLAADRWIRLNQAGAAGDAKTYVDAVAIDLPVVAAPTAGQPSMPVEPLRRDSAARRPRVDAAVARRALAVAHCESPPRFGRPRQRARDPRRRLRRRLPGPVPGVGATSPRWWWRRCGAR